LQLLIVSAHSLLLTLSRRVFQQVPRSEEEQSQDKYDKDWVAVNRYTGLAYGFKSSLWSGDCLEAYGIHVQEKFDGLSYREIQDARGNYQDWLIFFVYGKRGR